MIVRSELLGSLTVEPDEVILFPAGLFGFPDCRRFVLVASEREGLFWLQSAEHPELAFLLMDPFPVFPGYAVDLGDTDLRELEGEEPGDILVLAIVTLPRTRDEDPTANLQGPLALNLRSRRARQLGVESSQYGVRCPFSLPAA